MTAATLIEQQLACAVASGSVAIVLMSYLRTLWVTENGGCAAAGVVWLTVMNSRYRPIADVVDRQLSGSPVRVGTVARKKQA